MRFRIFLDEGLVFIPMAPNKALGNDSKNLKTLTGFSESINSCAKNFSSYEADYTGLWKQSSFRSRFYHKKAEMKTKDITCISEGKCVVRLSNIADSDFPEANSRMGKWRIKISGAFVYKKLLGKFY